MASVPASGTCLIRVEVQSCVLLLTVITGRRGGAELDLVADGHGTLALRENVTVDLWLAADWAQRLLDGTARAEDLAVVPWFDGALTLLTGWDDDWVVVERERLRQRMLHA